jgi:hypothetical protein
MPVIGVAFDPDNGWLHWCDLSSLIRNDGLDAELVIPRRQHLNGQPELARFQKYIGAITQSQSLDLDLVSGDVDRQMEAAIVCYFIGREDGRVLVLLRRLLFSLDRAAQEFAVWQLGRAIPHSDMLHTSETMVSPKARALLRSSLTWTTDEACKLLGFIDNEGGLDRGTIGQTVLYLLLEDPDHDNLVKHAAIRAARTGENDIAAWALIISVYLAGEEGRRRLDQVLVEAPELRANWATSQLIESLDEHGFVALF